MPVAVEISGGNRKLMELFLAGLAVWDSKLARLIVNNRRQVQTVLNAF
jgi:hypothetical protein